jgi:hypothetical protein
MYDIMCRDKDGHVEKLEGDIQTYSDAQRIKGAWQKQKKPKFVYIKKS